MSSVLLDVWGDSRCLLEVVLPTGIRPGPTQGYVGTTNFFNKMQAMVHQTFPSYFEDFTLLLMCSFRSPVNPLPITYRVLVSKVVFVRIMVNICIVDFRCCARDLVWAKTSPMTLVSSLAYYYYYYFFFSYGTKCGRGSFVGSFPFRYIYKQYFDRSMAVMFVLQNLW